MARTWNTGRRFLLVLLLITLAGTGLRVAYVLRVTQHQTQLYGDQVAYMATGVQIAEGHGFRDPWFTTHHAPGADHPPLTSLLVAPAAWVYPHDEEAMVRWARLTMALVGGITVFGIGLAARRVAANVEVRPDHPVAMRVGWIAAAIAALSPTLWSHDGVIMSEGPGAAAVALFIWSCVRTLDRPTGRRMFATGALLGLTIMARSEAIVLAPLVLIPLAWTRRGDRADRGRAAPLLWLTLAGVGLLLVIGPWTARNLMKFERPVLLSTNDGGTLLGANCDEAYHGDTIGLWIHQCVVAESDPTVKDSSVSSAHYREVAFHYMRNHLHRLPAVVAARELRTWSLWSPSQEVYLNTGQGDRAWVSWASLWTYYCVAPLGLVGWWLLRRRDRPVWPLGAHAVAVTIIAAAFYGLARFRIGADVALTVGAAVTIEALVRRIVRRESSTDQVLSVSSDGSVAGSGVSTAWVAPDSDTGTAQTAPLGAED